MKRSGFKKLTFEEAMEKKREQQKRAQKKFLEKRKQNKKPKQKTPSQKRKERIKKLKTRLWKKFSRYIRMSYANEAGMVETSDGHYKHWKQTDCGHLFHNSERNGSLGGNELWYYENNFAPQSNAGNRMNANDSAKKYVLWAIDKYGKKEVERMQKMRWEKQEYTEEHLLEFEKHLDEKIKKEEKRLDI